MVGMLVVLTLLIALSLVAIGLLARWALDTVQGRIARNLSAAETIVNRQRIPEEWLAPHRPAVAQAQRQAQGAAQIDAIGLRVQQDCLRRLDELAGVFQTGAFADGDDARDLLMAELATARRRWAGALPSYFVNAVNGFYDDAEVEDATSSSPSHPR